MKVPFHFASTYLKAGLLQHNTARPPGGRREDTDDLNWIAPIEIRYADGGDWREKRLLIGAEPLQFASTFDWVCLITASRQRVACGIRGGSTTRSCAQ
jgi:hypothetical protein